MKNPLSLLWLAFACEGRIHKSHTLETHHLGHALASWSRSNRSQSHVHKAKISVCPFGDSLTDGLQGHDDVYVNVGGFRPALEKNLEAEGAELLGFRNCPCHAYPTATSLQLLQQLRKSGFKCGSETGPARYPDIALVLIGTNDLYRAVKVEQSMQWVKTMLTELWEVSRNTQVLIASVPKHPSNPGPFDSYNLALKNLVAELQNAGHRKNIEYVAMQEKTNLCTSSTCHYDHIHPNQAGYSLMADVWFEALRPKLSNNAELGEKKAESMPGRSSARCSAGGLSLAVMAFSLTLLIGA